MKKSIFAIGLLSLVMVLTSFTTTEIKNAQTQAAGQTASGGNVRLDAAGQTASGGNVRLDAAGQTASGGNVRLD